MKRIITIVIVLLAVLTASAQSGGFNPSNPPEPLLRQQLTVSVEPANAGSTQGSGMYAQGTNVNISTNGYTGYTFLYWKLNGTPIEANQNFTYVMTDKPATLVAVYEYNFNPANPSEPTSVPITYHLYLQAQPAGAGYFNRASGDVARPDFGVYLNATPNTNYIFEGWYDNETLLSSDAAFTYVMPSNNVTLTARFIYSPVSPNDPTGNQDNVSNTIRGDANNDGIVDIADAVCIVNHIVGKSTQSFIEANADADADGEVDIADAVHIVNFIVGKVEQLAPRKDMDQADPE